MCYHMYLHEELLLLFRVETKLLFQSYNLTSPMKWRSLNDGNIKLTKENRRAQNCPTFPSSKTRRTGRLHAWTRIIIQPLYVVKATFSFSSNYTLAFAQSAPNFVRHSNDSQVFYTENGCRINNAAEQQTNILILSTASISYPLHRCWPP